jgi:TadE-like protein
MNKSVNPRPEQGRGGQALVEFALVFPIFILILFGVLDVGRLVYTNSAVAQAAREGARLAAAEAAWVGLSSPGCVSSPTGIGAGNPGAHVCPPNIAALKNDIVDAVNRMAVGLDRVTTVYISCNAGEVSGDPAPAGSWTESSGGNGCTASGAPTGSHGDLISVRIEYDYRALTPVISSIIGTVSLSGSTTMVIN